MKEIPLVIEISQISLRQLEQWCGKKYQVEINTVGQNVFGSFTEI